MRASTWREVIVTWINSLELLDSPVRTFSDLSKSQFYKKLLNRLGVETSDDDICESVETFLKDEFSGFILKTRPWTSDEATLATTLLLLCGSLRHHELRSPLYGLSGSTQLCIQALIQKFISTPSANIDNNLLVSSLADIPSDDEDDSDPKNYISTPKSTLNASNCDTPDIKHKNAKIKSLQCKLELVEWDKQHLLEENDKLKQEFDALKKDHEDKKLCIKRLESQLFNCQDEMLELNNIGANNTEEFGKEKKLKKEIQDIELSLQSMMSEMNIKLIQNEQLEHQLHKCKESNIELVKRCEEAENKVDILSANLDDMEIVISTLKQTCNEQKEVIKEWQSKKDEESFSCEFETLESVVELKYTELEEEYKRVMLELQATKDVRDDLAEKVKQLCDDEENNNLKLELTKLKNDITEKDALLSEANQTNSYLLTALDKYSKFTDNAKERKNVLQNHWEALQNNEMVQFNNTTVDKLNHELILKESEIISLKKMLNTTKSKLESELMAFKKEIDNLSDLLCKSQSKSESFKEHVRVLETQVENLRGDLRVKDTSMLVLEQSVSMCEHEKAILERKIDFLTVEADKVIGLKSEIIRLKKENARQEEELHQERMELKKVKSQIEMDEKLNNAFDAKLAELQIKMRNQYDLELQKACAEYTEKISLFKKKMLRDKSHIEDLSSELWETSDRYLLASQEADALRSQLRRTRAALDLLSNNKRSHQVGQRSNPCLWLNDEEPDSWFNNKRVTLTTERWERRFSFTSQNPPKDDDDEVFDNSCLDDLKAGIIRLPANVSIRASCPVAGLVQTPNSSVEKSTCDKQVLLPDKPKKVKGQIIYSRPGPPTPRHRLSLQNLENVNVETLDKPASNQRRLSRLFLIGQNKNPKPNTGTNQSSPKMKKKNFFQRKFGSNRENIPPYN